MPSQDKAVKAVNKQVGNQYLDVLLSYLWATLSNIRHDIDIRDIIRFGPVGSRMLGVRTKYLELEGYECFKEPRK